MEPNLQISILNTMCVLAQGQVAPVGRLGGVLDKLNQHGQSRIVHCEWENLGWRRILHPRVFGG